MKDKSGPDPYVHGNSFANAPSAPSKSQRDSGWNIKAVSHWDFTEGRLSP